MSTRFWLFSAATIGAAAMMGVGLGAYSTRQPAPASAPVFDMADALGTDGASTPAFDSIDRGPRIIRCTGCGPTLAERRMAAELAGLDADGMIDETSDPVTPAYLPDDPPEAAAPPDPPAPSRLPPQPTRSGESPPSIPLAAPPPVTVTPTLSATSLSTAPAQP